MSYTGYTEGTFSEQINSFRNRNAVLEQQVAFLTEVLATRDRELKYLHTLLQKQTTDSSILQSEEQPIVNASVKTKTK